MCLSTAVSHKQMPRVTEDLVQVTLISERMFKDQYEVVCFFFLGGRNWLVNRFRSPRHLLLTPRNTSSTSAETLKTIL